MIHLGRFDLQNRALPHPLYQIALRLALLWTDCLHVNVGRDFQTRMAQQFLYDLFVALSVFPSSIDRLSPLARKTLGSNPYEQTYLTMFIRVAGSCDDEMPSRVNTETVASLCDEHDRSVNVKAGYDRLKDNNPTCAPWMGSLSYMDNEHSPALQAGDLLASRSKDFLVETIDNPRHETQEQIVARWKPILGRNVGVGCMDKSSLSLLVDANVLKKGKFSIYSTQQLTLFKGLT